MLSVIIEDKIMLEKISRVCAIGFDIDYNNRVHTHAYASILDDLPTEFSVGHLDRKCKKSKQTSVV